ncbi:MAG: sigma-70 family RNA polymerase sigma factor [Gaiellaceae bacterium]
MSALQAEQTTAGLSHAEVYAATLYQRHNRAVFRHCLRLLHRREDADDATQTTFLYALLNLRRGVVPEAELPWLYTIAGNACSSHRRTGQRRGLLEQARDLDTLQDALPTPERQTPATADDFRTALQALPDNQRKALLLREWQGLSYGEISTELGLSSSATETLLFRARKNLAGRLQEKTGHRTFSGLSFFPLIQSVFERAAATTAVIGLGAAATIAGIPSATPRQAARQLPVATATALQHVQRVAGTTGPETAKPVQRNAAQPSRSTRLTQVDRFGTNIFVGDAGVPSAPVGSPAATGLTKAEAVPANAPEPQPEREPAPASDVSSALPQVDLIPPDALSSVTSDVLAVPLATIQTVVQSADLPLTLPALTGSTP